MVCRASSRRNWKPAWLCRWACVACVVEYAVQQDCKFIACFAVLPAIAWWEGVGFTGVNLANGTAEKQLRPGCLVKSLDPEQLAQDLRALSQSYSFRHRVMLRWV